MQSSQGIGSIPWYGIDGEETIREEAEDLVSKGGSLELIIEGLYQLPPPLPTFRSELVAQKVLDDVWSRIDKTKQYEGRVKVLKRERLEQLSVYQMDEIRSLIRDHVWITEDAAARLREQAMLGLSRNTVCDAIFPIWYLALWKQSRHSPFLIQAESLNEFLEMAPYFRVGFNASNKDADAMVEYITQHIDNELDLIEVGVTGIEDDVHWYKISPRLGHLQPYLKTYEASKGISLKGFVAKLNGKTLFTSDFTRGLVDLGVSDGDVITLSARPTLGERVPLKQLHDENKHEKSSRAKPRRHLKNGTKGSSGNKQTLYVSPEEETEKLKQQHSEAMSSVFEEVDQRFRGIRERLTALTLQRTLPKERSKAPKPPATAAPISNPTAAGVAGKAGKSTFLVLVGEAENLYKTSKKPKGKKRRQPKSNRARDCTIAKVDLHGLTTEQALNRLDRSLPGWIDAAMKGSYPFVIKVEIVCGCGNQVLAEAVEAWIRRQKNVGKAPHSPSI